MSDMVRLERRGPVAHLVLDRPAKLNAIDVEGLHALRRAVDEVAADPDVRVMVVRGEGPAFCSGVDLGITEADATDRDGWDRVVTLVQATFAALEASPVPSIAAVHGPACAGGLELVLACDLAVAAEGARLGDVHARHGLFPGGGASQRLPRLVGPRRAAWLLLSGAWLDAPTAADWGLVNEVVPDGELAARVDEVALTLAERSPLLAGAIKEAVRRGRGLDLPAALAAERPVFLDYMGSEDARIGLEAFATRTRPRFVGR
ncbi:MAG: enoyl-CoA hydratase/isomerase family protein [Acidimicrobiia bacterium]